MIIKGIVNKGLYTICDTIIVRTFSVGKLFATLINLYREQNFPTGKKQELKESNKVGENNHEFCSPDLS